ncbi:MAG: glycoside hydrolase family 26 protein [Erysipelotrichaceae bacterium]|nr:glycoside hydrolase family 26 protein [Erysipelotrichaceae bacterium]
MKKQTLLTLSFFLCLSGCNTSNNDSSSDEESISSSDTSYSEISSSSEEVISNKDILLDEDYSLCLPLNDVSGSINNFLNEYKDDYEFYNSNNVIYEQVYKNNKLSNSPITIEKQDDVKYIFYNNNNHARIISLADGYGFTIPTSTTLQADFSLGTYRSKVYNEDFTLTISYEHSNPYNNWTTYREEWLFRYLDNENYYTQNDLSLLSTPKKSSSTFFDGYIVDEYNLMINNPGQIKKNYYNIATIRKNTSIKDFILLVMKSNKDMKEDFSDVILSYKEIEKKGSANNQSINDLPVIKNPLWNEQTSNYYDPLLNSSRTNWGAFTATLTNGTLVESQIKVSTAYKKFTALSEALDYDFDILPTYQHIAWDKKTQYYWPTSMANYMAQGNGYNGKPVIQMSYQFTDNNNNVSVANTTDCYTPMFDIYRGKDDTGVDYGTKAPYQNRYALKLKTFALDVKNYGYPVLFRLNNEMNSDWVSYCGMMTLLDPDIFQATWRIIYNVFEQEGVDNCIWIFNPIAKTCPFSSWGEDMCYFPGINYVQALGLTSYRDNNNNEVNESTFRNDYTLLYEKNNPVWNNYPWIISEFGCGSGGDTTGKLYRNQASQVKYINGMFNDFNNRDNNPYLQNIKGAVWFSVNDYSGEQVVNQYELVIDELKDTINALKNGLSKNKLG